MSAPPAPRSTSAPSSGLVVGGYLCALFVRSSASSSASSPRPSTTATGPTTARGSSGRARLIRGERADPRRELCLTIDRARRGGVNPPRPAGPHLPCPNDLSSSKPPIRRNVAHRPASQLSPPPRGASSAPAASAPRPARHQRHCGHHRRAPLCRPPCRAAQGAARGSAPSRLARRGARAHARGHPHLVTRSRRRRSVVDPRDHGTPSRGDARGRGPRGRPPAASPTPSVKTT